ncbi:hypothetical protein [Prevotella sp. KH2C16]|uniref:hypothetical protein n=1 Tax=Prevotella sp. KH2C16 TaxID=1855325 RepID=UPI0008E09159|nr:hypothetical protein [Prevotella sp. KH2C16]SFG74587.1 hypothetical protein SAMN05216383_13710 [Prevotella sp. KH2C16]
MTIYMNIVGLRYYALRDDRWQELFDGRGSLKPALSGRELILRRAAGAAVDGAVEALCGTEQWGNVADDQKLVASSWLEAQGLGQITTTIVGGDYDMHALTVRAELDGLSLAATPKDFVKYEEWMRSASDLPTLMPTAAEQQLDRTLSSLEWLAGQGRWSHDAFAALLPLLSLDLSGDTALRLQRLLPQLDSDAPPETRHDAHALRCALVHLGSTESRLAWKAFWQQTAARSPQMDTLRCLARHADAARLEALLLAFPGEVFALMDADPVLAVARLHYARLPRAVLRKFVSLWLLWLDSVQPAGAGEQPDRPDQFTAQQTAILAYYLLDAQRTLSSASHQAVAELFALLSGYRERTIVRKLDFQARFDSPRVQQDLHFVASKVRHLFPEVYAKIMREME